MAYPGRFQSSSIREPYSTIRYVHIESDEFKSFIRDIEQNYENNSSKMSACLLCWGFLTSYQKQKHLEHAHYTITPSFFRNQEMYLKHAKAHDKIQENGNMVALFNEQCKMIVGNPYIVQPSTAGLSQAAQSQNQTQTGGSNNMSQMSQITNNRLRAVPANQVLSSFQNSYSNVGASVGRGNLPMNSLSFNSVKDVQQRQFDQEQIIKKLTINVITMQEKISFYDLRIKQLENKIESNFNEKHKISGQKQKTKVFKKTDKFIMSKNEQQDTAETESKETSQEIELPVPGIDVKALMSSQISAVPNTFQLLQSQAKQIKADEIVADKITHSQLNRKSKGIKKQSQRDQKLSGKSKYLNRGRTLMVQDMDGPALAKYTVRQQEQYKGSQQSE